MPSLRQSRAFVSASDVLATGEQKDRSQEQDASLHNVLTVHASGRVGARSADVLIYLSVDFKFAGSMRGLQDGGGVVVGLVVACRKEQRDTVMSRERIAIIGAGPAGAARGSPEPRRARCDRLRTPHIGGRTFTYRDGDDHLDTGAGFITNFYPRVQALTKRLGFSDQIKELNRVTDLFTQGQLAAMNVGSLVSFLKFPFMGLRKRCAWRPDGVSP